MKKIFLLGFCCFLFACQDKEVLLPMAAETVVADVKDHSPVYLFFKIQGEDTLVDVNRKSTISSTNWLFNVDKRLPLRKVILEVKKLQSKKEGSMHKSETSENYFTYNDTVKKTMAFFPFTKVKYKLENPNSFNIYMNKYGLVRVGNDIFSKNELQGFLDTLSNSRSMKVCFAYDKQMSFGRYIETKFFVKKLLTKKGITINYNLDYIY
ncbi:hypothetical protein ACSVH2_13350 [Flavobacterium sp. RSB2_4_14]|uniref:hypothetical protein n=1 Tax=Flavobacterium sp. RSB2_4_14 TaxID=3447665 RepID=UPI003F30309E